MDQLRKHALELLNDKTLREYNDKDQISFINTNKLVLNDLSIQVMENSNKYIESVLEYIEYNGKNNNRQSDRNYLWNNSINE